VADLADDHRCSWRDEAERLQARVSELETKLGEVSEQLAEKTAEVDGWPAS